MASVELTLQGDQFIREAERIAAVNRQIRESFQDIESVTTVFDRELGRLTGRFTRIDEAGRRLTSSFEATRRGIQLVGTTVRDTTRQLEQSQIDRIRFIDQEVRARQRAIAAEREQLRIQQQVTQTQTAIRRPETQQALVAPGTSEAQVQSFIRAEAALVNLARTGRATGAELTTALNQARSGAISLATATTEAQQAAVRLTAAEAQLGAQTERTTASTRGLTDGLIGLARVTGIALIIGQVFRLEQAFEEAAGAAIELSVAIAQIDTIQNENRISTDDWERSLRGLSDSFGLDILDQAEAAYLTLSNQVAQGAEAVTFLDAANRLAITGVTETASAVNLLTATINAFNRPVEDAELISARFFRTVELGRVRVEELSEIFGRVAVPANQLGISLEELQASIATITIQGVRADEALTLIRNIILKLLRPTEALKGFFADLGVSSGQAAIETFGFGGFLQLLEERAQGSATEIGELFGRIRAITGALAFAGENANVFQNNLRKIEETNVAAFAERTNTVLESTGQRLRIAANEAKNFFEVELGRPAIDALADLIDSLGGVNNILIQTGRALDVAGSAIELVAITQIPKLIIALNTATESSRATLTAFLATSAGITTAIGVAIVSISELIKDSAEESLRELEAANAAVFDANEERERSVKNLIAEEVRATEAAANDSIRAFRRASAERQNLLFREQQQLESQAEEFERAFSVINRRLTSGLNAAITAQNRLFNESKRNAEQAANAVEELFERFESREFGADLRVAGIGQQIELLDARLNQLRQEAQAAALAGDTEVFAEAAKQIETLSQQRIKAAIDLRSEELRISREIQQARIEQSEAGSQRERDRIQERIRALFRERRIIQEGTASQLDNERRIQELREQASDPEATDESRSEALNEIEKLQTAQRQLNRLAEEEQEIRLDGLKEVQELARQFQQLQQLNEQRQRSAEEERRRLQASQFALNLLTKEAEAFNAETALESDNIGEITSAIEQQQQRFARIIELQRQIGAGAEAESIIRNRANNLQEQATNRLRSLQEQANQEQVTAINERLTAEINAINEASAEDVRRLKALQEASENVVPDFEILSDLQVDLTVVGAQDFLAEVENINDILRPSLFLLAQDFTQLSRLTKQQLDDPTTGRGELIESLTETIRSTVEPVAGNIANLLSRGGLIGESEQAARDLLTAFSALSLGTQGAIQVAELENERNFLLRRQAELLEVNTDQIESGTNAQEEQEEAVRSLTETVEAANTELIKLADTLRTQQETAPAVAPGLPDTATLAPVIEQIEPELDPVTTTVTDTATFEAARQGATEAILQSEAQRQAVLDQETPTVQAVQEQTRVLSELEQQRAERENERAASALAALQGVATPEQELQSLGIAVQQFTTSAENLAQAQESRAERENKRLQEELRQAREARRGFATGGFVGGPGGIDNVPAMLTAGEFVVNRQSTQRFLPQLLAMNAFGLQPQRFQNGGTVENVNFGGFTVNEARSPQITAKAVEQIINRGIRLGTIKIRKS